jgi:hypothetical protein
MQTGDEGALLAVTNVFSGPEAPFNLAQPSWENISGSETTNSVSVPLAGERAFFRLMKR